MAVGESSQNGAHFRINVIVLCWVKCVANPLFPSPALTKQRQISADVQVCVKYGHPAFHFPPNLHKTRLTTPEITGCLRGVLGSRAVWVRCAREDGGEEGKDREGSVN